MKQITFSVISILFVGLTSQAQQLSSDDPSFHQNTNSAEIQVPVQPTSNAEQAVASTVILCPGEIDSLESNGSCYNSWSTDSLGANVISTSSTLNIGPYNSDTLFYLTTTAGAFDSVVPLPNQSGVFTGNVRGYYFTAPVDFTMTGLFVPTNNPGNQNVEILRFDNQTPPPIFSGTTNAFTSLGYWNNHNASDTIDVCIQVTAGDVIGIYGNRNDANSYAPAPAQSMIGGVPVTLTRSGMQANLSTSQMANVFSEAAGSISRVQFFYDLDPDTTTFPVNVVVPSPISSSTSLSICSGEAVLISGAFQTVAGTYFDTLQAASGCDSTVTINLSVNPTYFDQVTASICQGDSIFLGGAYQTTSGVYLESDSTTSGCDSITQTTLSINALPTLTLSGADTTLCLLSGSVVLTGTPAGGTYSGPGVSGSVFDPASAGVGTHSLTYTFTDGIGCSNDISVDFNVQNCAGLDENALIGVKVYPNPAREYVKVEMPTDMTQGGATIYDVNGRIIRTWSITSNTSIFNIADLSKGVYVLEVENINKKTAKFRLIKK